MNKATAPIERVAEHRVYGNRFVTVYDDDVRFASGRRGQFVRIIEGDGSPGVVALPLCDGYLALVRTYRYAIQAFEWSFPRGFADGPNSAAEVVRELTEELGIPPLRTEQLGRLQANSGLLSGYTDVFVAEYPSKHLASPDDEVHDIRWISTPDLVAEIRLGKITDGFTLSALCLAIATNTVTL